MTKVAWVTGGSRGMGADTALRLARSGYDVALTARDQGRLDGVAKEIEAVGQQALPFAADLTDRGSVAAFADAAIERFGRCDVLCNIAIHQGQGAFELFLDTTPDDFAVTYEVDVVAPVILCQRAIPLMVAEGGGTIVNMSSSSVFLDPPGTVKDSGWSLAYVAAKAGIDQFASVLNVELGAQGIRAFNVEPGFVAYGEELVRTLAKYPGMPVSPPESIGPAILWLIESGQSDRLMSKRVNLPGLTHKQGLLEGWDGPGSVYPPA
ncbi:MAG TPA: SDR family oxidoreductase [Acidimicrobiales bacterium]